MKKLFDRQLAANPTLDKNHSVERLQAVYEKMKELYTDYDGAEISAAIARIRQDIERERELRTAQAQLEQAQALLKEINDRMTTE